MSIRNESNLMISRRYLFLDISLIEGAFWKSVLDQSLCLRKISLTGGETIEGKPDGRFR